MFLYPLFSVLSFLLWNSLWLVEELLTLNGDFSILKRDINVLLSKLIPILECELTVNSLF